MTDSNGTPVPPSGEPTANPVTPPPAAPTSPTFSAATPPAASSEAAGAQPAYSAAPAAPSDYSAPAATAGVDPGKGLGIIGFVLAFFIQIAGLIVSIIARSKSKKAGYKNGWATAGIIVSIVLMIVGIIAAIAFFSLVASGALNVDECAGLAPGLYERPDGTQVTCG